MKIGKGSTRSRQIADASVGWSRRRQTPARCIAVRDPQTTNARCRRPAPVRQRNRAAAAAGGCACAAYDRATARRRSSTGARSHDQPLSHEPRAASRPPRSGQNPNTTRGSSPEPRAAPPRACAGCRGDRVASRSGRSDLRSCRPSATETPDGARARAADSPPRSSIAADPNPAAPRAAAAPDRSSAEPSPQTPPRNPPGSVISNWHTGDILIRRLHCRCGRPRRSLCAAGRR